MNKENLPKISVVTPCFNRLGLLKETVDSVFGNKYPNLEYVIADGGSSDGAGAFIRSIEKELSWWCSEKDSGPYAAVNKGFSNTTGEIMAWLNAGDIYFPWTLAEVAKIFSRFPEINWIMGIPSKIRDNAVCQVSPCMPRPKEFIRAGLYLKGDFGPIQQESCFWRRRLWEKAGPLKEETKFAADFELWTRFAKFSELVCAGTLLSGFSLHENQNRSILYRNRYENEALEVIGGFSRHTKLLQKKILREMEIFKKLKNYTGIKNLVKRILGLNKYKGKVLKWDFSRKEYLLRDKTYF